jgi:hypothetical protein
MNRYYIKINGKIQRHENGKEISCAAIDVRDAKKQFRQKGLNLDNKNIWIVYAGPADISEWAPALAEPGFPN